MFVCVCVCVCVYVQLTACLFQYSKIQFLDCFFLRLEFCTDFVYSFIFKIFNFDIFVMLCYTLELEYFKYYLIKSFMKYLEVNPIKLSTIPITV